MAIVRFRFPFESSIVNEVRFPALSVPSEYENPLCEILELYCPYDKLKDALPSVSVVSLPYES